MDSWQYTTFVEEIFPNKSNIAITEAVETVLRETPDELPEYQLENVINLLIDTTICEQFIPSIQEKGVGDCDDNEENLLDEAAGHSTTIYDKKWSVCSKQLPTSFPDARPPYVRYLYDYPKKKDAKAVFMQLKELLPNADPSYLRKEAEVLACQSENELERFVEDAIEKCEYPTMENYLTKQKEMEKINQYTINFSIEEFLKTFPDPEHYFLNTSWIHPLASVSSEYKKKMKKDEAYALEFLYNYYSYLRKKDIDRVFKMNSKNLTKTCRKLDGMRRATRMPRKTSISDITTTNIRLVQEIAYLKHKKIIKRILKEYDLDYRMAKEEALHNGLLQTCACCFDEALIPEECYFCKNGCIFCKDCVKRGAETVIGEGKLDFMCLADCGAEFSIPTLQMVLDSVVFSRMAQRKQMEEIKRANIDGLETCPFCDFATIPPPDDKIFRCLNSECMKESCRECRHVAHIPLRCNEIEYDEDVKMRTYIENKMTEALLRKCWKCSKMFIKESGCNKMTCSCGAGMCYVCGEAVTDYTHFGPDDGNRCPLYTKDLNRFHASAVIRGASAAKVELGVDKNPNMLKTDPAKGLEEHYAI